MRDVMYSAYFEYVDTTIGFIGDDFESAADAEKVARERLGSKLTSEYIEREHSGVAAIIVRKSEEVKRIDL